jgi:hypothetical protein
LPDQARNLSTFGTFKNFISTLVFFWKLFLQLLSNVVIWPPHNRTLQALPVFMFLYAFLIVLCY